MKQKARFDFNSTDCSLYSTSTASSTRHTKGIYSGIIANLFPFPINHISLSPSLFTASHRPTYSTLSYEKHFDACGVKNADGAIFCVCCANLWVTIPSGIAGMECDKNSYSLYLVKRKKVPECDK